MRWALVVALAACGRIGFGEHEPPGVGPDAPGTPGDGVVPGDGLFPSACLGNPFYQPGSTGALSLYRQVNQFKSWAEAKAICEADGAHLAIVDNALEANEPLINDWIGITDEQVEGEWRTLTGALATFLPWDTGEPDGGTSENCGRISNSGLIEARECIDARDFSCECEILEN